LVVKNGWKIRGRTSGGIPVPVSVTLQRANKASGAQPCFAARLAGSDITVFDSTGLAIQDLAIALAAMERVDELDLPQIAL